MTTEEPIRATLLRRQAVAFELGITRHTLSRIIARDRSFPRFFAISPGIEVIERAALDLWIERKKVASRMPAPDSPAFTSNDQG